MFKEQILKSTWLILTFTVCHFVSAQSKTENANLTITIGDTIVFGSDCDSGVFKKVDLYTKTRYIDTVLRYDTLTGEGFYKTFFAEGDFDAKRLPCSYANRKFTITATQYFTDNNTGEDRFVVFVQLELWNKVAWIEFIDAYEAKEILLK